MPASVRARLFGPGLPATGMDARLAVRAGSIDIESGDVRKRLALTSVVLRNAGSSNGGLEIGWNEAGSAWVAQVLDAREARAVLALPEVAALAEARSLGARNRRTGSLRVLGWSAIALFLLAPLVVLAVFVWQADRIAAWVTDRITIEQEVQLGRQIFASLETGQPGTRLLPRSPSLAPIESIAGRLTAGSHYAYEYHVADDPTLNAFAIPGGIVVVHTGLIAATRTPEELAGVLAHEVQHVELRHSLRGIVKALGLRALWSMLSGELGSTIASQGALELVMLRFSRAAEEEADQRGFESLLRAGIDPAGMARFFERLEAQSGSEPPELLSTHPLSAGRRAAIEQRLETLGGQSFAPAYDGKWPPPA